MSYYPGRCAPNLTSQHAPVSPVPSYQSSSQSGGTTSPGSRSSMSDSFRGNSNGRGASPSSPLWASPGSPFSYNSPLPPESPYSVPTLSPVSSPLAHSPVVVHDHGGDSDGVGMFRDKSQPLRECSSNVQDLGLMEATVGKDVVNVVHATPENGHEDKNWCKSDVDVSRERGASMRALALLESTAGRDVKNFAFVTRLDENISEYKSELEIVRERGSNMRALALLEATVGKEVSDIARATSVSGTKTSALTTRQAAQLVYERRLKEKLETKAKLASEKQTYGKPIPTLIAKQGKEKLAVSTRKPRPKTADDVRDPESVAGMKCQMDIEREKMAMKKALQLLSYGCMV